MESCHRPPEVQVCVTLALKGWQRRLPATHTLQTAAVQAPGSPPTLHVAPLVALATLHVFVEQVATRQGFPGSGHCEAVVH
jgi:hypothetical protein